MCKRLDLMIINRSFWPVYPVIGEALMRFAEQQASIMRVGVVLQDHSDIRKNLETHGRGQNVQFFPCRAYSVSGSSIYKRIFDAFFFMLWVFCVLLLKRPKKVYISTDPPVLIPFVVAIYSKLFDSKFIYHLQDIHPEAASVVVPLNTKFFNLFRWMDSFSMRCASTLITITNEMADEILSRSGVSTRIHIFPNPSIHFDEEVLPASKTIGFSFCGNAGRLQRIPLLIESIDKYCMLGGRLPFVFAGSGVYAEELKHLATRHPNVTYLGFISPLNAAFLNAKFQWALLPIEDEVTRFAFPSKSSSYVYSDAQIAAICSQSTSVARWVENNKLGIVVDPNVDALCDFFFMVDKGEINAPYCSSGRMRLKEELSFDVFVERLCSIV